MNIIPAIRDLLLRNQKAVVPGLGSFSIVHRPAQINKVTRVITPPKMIIRFDREQHSDDGSLLGYLVRKLKQDTSVAEKAISDFTTAIHDDIRKKGSSIIEGLGTLSRQASGDIHFEPDEELVKRISLFELPKINIPATAPVTAAQTSTAPPESARTERRRRWWIPAIILLFVLLIGFLGPIYLTGNMDTLVSDIKAAISGDKRQPEEEKLVFGPSRDDTDTSQVGRKLDEQVDREKALSIGEPVAAKDQEKEPQSASTNQTTTGIPETGKPYHIISGAFLVPNNADRHMELLQKSGINAFVLPRKGDYYMVSLGSYTTLTEATAAMKQLQGKVKNELWVLKK